MTETVEDLEARLVDAKLELDRAERLVKQLEGELRKAEEE